MARKQRPTKALTEAMAEIATLKKKLEEQEKAAKWTSDRSQALSQEIDQMHAVFDAVPGLIKRKDDDGYTPRNIVTRFAGWLAVARVTAA